MKTRCTTQVERVIAFIALGANLGNPLQQIDTASLAIGAHEKITRHIMSPVYRSQPQGEVVQRDFLNAVLQISTTLSAEALLDVLQQIEIQQGRDRSGNALHWGPRIIDLDIILFADEIMTTERLTIPHSYAHQREFVIQPLLDLSNKLLINLTIPGHGAVSELAESLPINTMEIIRDVTTYND